MPDNGNLLIKLFLLATAVLLMVDILYLNIKISSLPSAVKPVNNYIKPSFKPKETDSVNKLSKEDVELTCSQIVQQSIATLSAQNYLQSLPSAKITTIYQQTAPKQPQTLYIPLGGSISSSSQNWGFTGGAEAYFNPADYSGYKKITFEAFLKIKDSNGQANARLYDATNKVIISSSEIWGSGDTLHLQSSLPLQLLAGSNLLQVQLRTTTGYEAYLESPRLKVDFK